MQKPSLLDAFTVPLRDTAVRCAMAVYCVSCVHVVSPGEGEKRNPTGILVGEVLAGRWEPFLRDAPSSQ